MWNIDRMLSIPVSRPPLERVTVAPLGGELPVSTCAPGPPAQSEAVLRSRRERLAKVPVPLDQRIVQGPLRDPRGSLEDDEVRVGAIRMPADLLTEYAQARDYLSRSELGHSILLQAEDGRNDSGRRFSLEIENTRSVKVRVRSKDAVPPGNSANHRTIRAFQVYGRPNSYQHMVLNCIESVIRWNPRGALMTASGKALSPAVILAHELIHALHSYDGRRQYNRALRSKLPQFTNVEELRTLRLERRLARDLGEGVRQLHADGVRFPVESVTGAGGLTYPEIVSDANVKALQLLPNSTVHPLMAMVEKQVFSGEEGALPLGASREGAQLQIINAKAYRTQVGIEYMTDRLLRR